MMTRQVSTLSLLLTLACWFGLTVAPTFAGGRIPNVAEMTAAAARVVHGRVTDVRAGQHPTQPSLAVLFVKLEVIESLKGSPAREISFMQFAGGVFSHLPTYRVGEEVLLFLYPESRYGLTSPVGEGAGKFRVFDDARTGRRVLRNEAANYALFDRLDKSKLMTALTLNAAESEPLERLPWTERAGAELNSFRSLVRKLAANPRAAAAARVQ